MASQDIGREGCFHLLPDPYPAAGHIMQVFMPLCIKLVHLLAGKGNHQQQPQFFKKKVKGIIVFERKPLPTTPRSSSPWSWQRYFSRLVCRSPPKTGARMGATYIFIIRYPHSFAFDCIVHSPCTIPLNLVLAMHLSLGFQKADIQVL